MQTLYICDLPLPGCPESGWKEAENVLEAWTVQRMGLRLPVDGTEHHNSQLGTNGRTVLLDGTDGSRLRLWQLRKVDPARPLWAHDVSAWLGVDRTTDSPQATVRIRLGAHALHGRVAELPGLPAAPGVVRTLLDEHHVEVDGQRLGHTRTFGVTDIPALLQLLLDEQRRRPVLVLTAAPGLDRPAIDPQRTAARLAGLAHVVVTADRAATYALTDGLGGTELSVFNGAARLYWPGLQLDARRGDHPLWFLDRLVSRGPTWFADKLFARLGRISALALGPPPLEKRLRREVEQGRRSTAAAQLADLSRQHNDALGEIQRLRSAAETAVPEEDISEDDWFSEHERVLDELEATANERDELQAQLDQLQQQFDVAQDNIKAMAMATGAREPAATGDQDAEPASPEPDTVLAAVEWAAATCPHLELLPEAFTSARASEFPRPRQVLDDLAALEKVAAAWARDELPGGVEPALVAEGCSGYRSGISSTARNRYPGDYQRLYQDRTITLGPHIARGTGAPNAIMRIYWYADTEARVFVVGHVGRKLRDDSNS